MTLKPAEGGDTLDKKKPNISRGTRVARIRTTAKKVAKTANMVRIANSVRHDIAYGNITSGTIKRADKFLSKINDPSVQKIRHQIAAVPADYYKLINKSQKADINAESGERKKDGRSNQLRASIVQISNRAAGVVNDGTVGGQSASILVKGIGRGTSAAYGSVRTLAKAHPVSTIKRTTSGVIAGVRTAAMLSLDIRKGRFEIRSVKNAIYGYAAAKAVRLATKPHPISVPKMRAVKKAIRVGSSELSRLSSSKDTMLQGVGYTAQAARIGVKGIQTSATVAKGTASGIKTGVQTGIQTSVKTVKTVKKTVNYARKHGAAQTAKKAVSKAGGSVISAALELISKLSTKSIAAICLVAGAIAAFNSVLIAPVGAIGSIFGGVFSEKDSSEEINIAEYVKQAVTGYTDKDGNPVQGLRDKYIQKRIEDMNDMLDDGYHYVEYHRADRKNGLSVAKLYDRNGGIERISPDSAFNGFYTADEITNVIQPIFNVVIFQKYEMEPTEEQARKAVEDIFNDLFVIDTITDDTEYCGAPDGWCGKVHANTGSCYHYETEYHADYVCDMCDKYVCNGHTSYTYHCDGYIYERRCCHGHYIAVLGKYMVHTRTGIEYMERNEAEDFANNFEWNAMHPEDQWYGSCNNYEWVQEWRYCDATDGCEHGGTYDWTTFYHGDAEHRFTYHDGIDCDNKTLTCTGHNTCLGHKRYIGSISMDGISGLMEKYFTNEIKRLSEIEHRTEEENKKLSELQDNYDILLELVTVQGQEFGALSAKELARVQFTDESKTEARRNVLNSAVGGIGNVGGKPYWSACGYSKHTDWNTCFVYAIMQNNGVAEYTGIEGLNGKTDFDDLVSKLRSEPRYRDSSYSEVKQGDIAILSNCVGIVAGIDKEGSIYVIIGDNGDVCRCMRYLPERISGYYVIN